MGALALLMILEYRSLSSHVDRVITMQRQYQSYFPGETCEENNNEKSEEETCASFIVVNRSPEHLKESTMSYFKDQNLGRLAARIEESEWEDYSDLVLSSAQRKKAVIKKQPRRAAQPRRRRAAVRKTSGIFSWPIDESNFWLSSFFGPRRKPNGSWGFHYGVDMAAIRGTPVRAAADGVVEEARYATGYGNTVVVRHNGVYKTRYAHLDTIRTRNGAHVKKGDRLGTVGDTGFTRKTGRDASHLHFEVYERGEQVNPLNFLSLN
jgi:murein DD-endopeptidase MepM/ murein hydrolase activator NlpD